MQDGERNRYYRVLGLDAGASPDQLKRARRDMVQVWHPDRFTANSRLQKMAQEKLREINEAYEKLKSMDQTGAAAARPAAANPQTTRLANRALPDRFCLVAQATGA